MAFSFGSTSQPQTGLNFGANQSKPTFGATGAPGTSFSFGTTQATTAPTFGFGAAAAGPTAGATAAAAPSSVAPNFGFGSNFGTTTTTQAVPSTSGFGSTLGGGVTGAFGGFGTTGAITSTAAAPAATGFNFGATTASTAGQTGFTFGSGATTTTTAGTTGFGGFGTLSTQGTTGIGTFGGFGTTTATSGPSLFGGGTTSTFGTGLGNTTFGAKPISGGTGTFNFGSNFGTNTFGTSGGTTFGIQQQQQQQQQQQIAVQDPNALIANAILNVHIFGDERDTIIAKWNLLQAVWGVGKGYYHPNQPPVEFKLDNPYCRFKAIVYGVIPERDNKDGIVSLIFGSKKEADIKAQLPQIQNTLVTSVLGNKPELKLNVFDLRTMPDETVRLNIYVEEKNSFGTTRKIPSSDLANFFNQTIQKQQLNNLGVVRILSNLKIDTETIQDYLKVPPLGIDPRIWKQAQEDNPNPEKFIPVPVIGFNQLKARLQMQENETLMHRAYIDQVTDEIAALKQKRAASAAQIAEYKHKFLDLQHRVLKVLVKQEMYRKVGMALQPEEEQLRIQLENMQAQVSVPTQFRGRLTELLAHIRILRCDDETIASTSGGAQQDRYTIEPEIQQEIKEFLCMEQVGINHLIDIINNDQETLKKIKDGLVKILQT